MLALMNGKHKAKLGVKSTLYKEMIAAGCASNIPYVKKLYYANKRQTFVGGMQAVCQRKALTWQTVLYIKKASFLTSCSKIIQTKARS